MGITCGGYFVLCGWRSARQVLGAYGHDHENCQKNVKMSESSGKSRRTRLSKKFCRLQKRWWRSEGNLVGITCGGYFVLYGWCSARHILGAYGHDHENCQKNVKVSESNRKSRRIRLSKNSVDCSSAGGAVREIWWVFRALWPVIS